jgi:hypothetical protein
VFPGCSSPLTSTLREVRCEVLGPDHLQMQLFTPPAAAPERYDLEGDACVVQVRTVELRPGFALLGVRALSRVGRIGPLPPPHFLRRRLTDLVVSRSESVPVMVPSGAQKRLVVVPSPSGPTLEQPSS